MNRILDGQLSLFDQAYGVGKMCQDSSPVTVEKTSALPLKRSQESKTQRFLYLDLRRSGAMPGFWMETDGALHGASETQLSKEFLKGEEESFLSQILEETVPEKYSLSRKACIGILRRSLKRGKTLPLILASALVQQAKLSKEEYEEIVAGAGAE